MSLWVGRSFLINCDLLFLRNFYMQVSNSRFSNQPNIRRKPPPFVTLQTGRTAIEQTEYIDTQQKHKLS